MKRVLALGIGLLALATVGPALAADKVVVTKPAAPAVVVVKAYNWSGFYLGINGGWATGNARFHYTTGSLATFDESTKGTVIGGTAGFNQQFGTHWLWGLEGDLDWANIHGSTVCAAPIALQTCDTQIRSLGTGRLRVGVTANRLLFYGTIGVAFGTVRARSFTTTPGAVVGSSTATGMGWAGGGGVEIGIHGTTSLKAEWLHYELGNTNNVIDSGLAVTVH